MKSRWVDRDAQAAVDRYAAAGIAPRPGAARLHHAPARPRSQAGAARRRQHLGQDDACPTCSATRSRCCASRARAADMAAIEPAGLPAVRLDALRKLRARDDALRRGHGARAARQPARSDGAQSVGRNAAARLPAAQIRRPHPRQRRARAWSTSRTAQRICAEVYDGRMGFVPYVMPGFGLAKAAAEVFDAKPDGRRPDPRQARHLHLRRRARAKPTSA